MKTLAAIVFALGIIAWPSLALATCTTQTYFDGLRTKVCTVCCDSYGNCQTICS